MTITQNNNKKRRGMHTALAMVVRAASWSAFQLTIAPRVSTQSVNSTVESVLIWVEVKRSAALPRTWTSEHVRGARWYRNRRQKVKSMLTLIYLALAITPIGA